jgi:hypothetical protein
MSEHFFIYYLAAIGGPNLDIKLDILKHNLNSIFENIKIPFDIMINFYDEDEIPIEKMLKSLPFIKNIIIHKKKGRLVELWYTNPYHDLLKKYSYIFYILDDVQIQNMDVLEMIAVKKKYYIEFLSPKVIGGTWDYMRKHDNNILAFANNIEIFCLLFNYNDFNKFMLINDIENTYTWGTDLVLGYHNIKSAIYYKFVVQHMLPSETDGSIAGDQMHAYLNKRGFKSVGEINEKYKPIYKIKVL